LEAGESIGSELALTAGEGLAEGVMSVLEASELLAVPGVGVVGTTTGFGTSIILVAPGTRIGLGTSTTFGGGAGFSTVRSMIVVWFGGVAGAGAAGLGGTLMMVVGF